MDTKIVSKIDAYEKSGSFATKWCFINRDLDNNHKNLIVCFEDYWHDLAEFLSKYAFINSLGTLFYCLIFITSTFLDAGILVCV